MRAFIIGSVALAVTLVGAAPVFAGPTGENPRDTAGTTRASARNPDGKEWFLRTAHRNNVQVLRVQFGALTDTPISGNWDGSSDGSDEVGLFRPSNNDFFLRANNEKGSQPLQRRRFGSAGDIPVSGNWDTSTPGDEFGVFRPSNNEFFLRNADGSVSRRRFGAAGDIPVVGNWDGSADGSDEIGVYRPSSNEYFLRSSNDSSASVNRRKYGTSGDLPVVGDWDRDGTDTIGIFRPSNRNYFLANNTTGAGSTDVRFAFGNAGDLTAPPGDWDGADEDDESATP